MDVRAGHGAAAVVTDERGSGPCRGATVLLADEEAATRAGVRRRIEAHGLRVVGEARSAAAAVSAAITEQPDVCVLAVRMPGGGIEAARQIHDAVPDTKIVMLTASAREDDLFAAVRAGADGYLLKSMSPARLPHAILGVLSGEAALPRRMTALLIREFRDRPRRRSAFVSASGRDVELTSREFEVLEQLRRGDSTHEIASLLRISQVTVRRHISSVLHKLGVANRRTALALLEQEHRG